MATQEEQCSYLPGANMAYCMWDDPYIGLRTALRGNTIFGVICDSTYHYEGQAIVAYFVWTWHWEAEIFYRIPGIEPLVFYPQSSTEGRCYSFQTPVSALAGEGWEPDLRKNDPGLATPIPTQTIRPTSTRTATTTPTMTPTATSTPMPTRPPVLEYVLFYPYIRRQ